jgi:hypothetical protein
MVVVRGEEKKFTTLEESKPVLQFLPVHNRERERGGPPKGTLDIHTRLAVNELSEEKQKPQQPQTISQSSCML